MVLNPKWKELPKSSGRSRIRTSPSYFLLAYFGGISQSLLEFVESVLRYLETDRQAV